MLNILKSIFKTNFYFSYIIIITTLPSSVKFFQLTSLYDKHLTHAWLSGLGFLDLQYQLDNKSISPVSLTPYVRTGFTFIIINCCMILVSGILFKWRLPYQYSFVVYTMYILCIATSLEQLFT